MLIYLHKNGSSPFHVSIPSFYLAGVLKKKRSSPKVNRQVFDSDPPSFSKPVDSNVCNWSRLKIWKIKADVAENVLARAIGMPRKEFLLGGYAFFLSLSLSLSLPWYFRNEGISDVLLLD